MCLLRVITEVHPQSICDRLLTLDSKILYSSYLDSGGHRACEATKSLIENYDELTVMVLPVLPGKDALVLATPIGSDLADIVSKARKAFFAEP
jgi:hypothetical protein